LVRDTEEEQEVIPKLDDRLRKRRGTGEYVAEIRSPLNRQKSSPTQEVEELINDIAQ
jgi:hypothetical protein